MTGRTDAFLDADTVVPYLVGRGVLGSDVSGVSTHELGGGVSNVVLLVESGVQRVVVKQALPRLRVVQEWTASRERTLSEAEALGLAARLTPGATPGVVDVDSAACAIVIEAAPANWRTWKDALFEPVTAQAAATADLTETHVATALGKCLGRWHAATAGETLVGTRLDDPETFAQLRVRPYHETVIARRPDVAGPVRRVVDGMAGRRVCLVHGDFSPKNVLVGNDGLWVIDFEVAHLGDPAFDVAFLLCHLVMKSVHQPRRAAAHRAAAAAFLAVYAATIGTGGAAGDEVRAEGRWVTAHLGCLLLARVYGKSPAEYLSEPEQRRVAAAGTAMVCDPAADPLDVWKGLLP